jgi:hypothetical protein
MADSQGIKLVPSEAGINAENVVNMAIWKIC